MAADAYDFSLPVNLLPAHMNECRIRRQFTDIIIKVGDEEYPAHRIVLQAASPVMRTWLTDNWRNDNDVYEWSEQFVDSEIVEDLLTFFYTAKVRITADNANALSMASHYLNVTSLLGASERFLSERVVPENVLDLFLLADKLGLEILRRRCADCVVNHYETVLMNNRILTYSLEDINLLIREINGEDGPPRVKEVLFECLINWVENDSPSRWSSLPSLLRALPISELSQRFLCEVVGNQNLIRDSEVCAKLQISAHQEAYRIAQIPYKLYCFGGYDENKKYLSSVSFLDVLTGVWQTANPMSINRTHFAAAVVGRKIYIFGGWSKVEPESLFNLDTVEVYDCLTNTTTQLQPLPGLRSNSAAATLNEFIYISGGFNNVEQYSSVLRYNTMTHEFQEVAPMNHARNLHQMVALNGCLYVIGGCNTTTNMCPLEMYDPITDQWTVKTNTQYAHSWSGAAAHNGEIYICSNNGFEVYSPETNTWETLTPLDNFYGKRLVSMKGKLWALGGNTEQYRGSTSVHSYDIYSRQWTQEPNMDARRGAHCSFVVVG